MAIERWRIMTPPLSGKPSGKKRQFQSLHGTIENFHGQQRIEMRRGVR
jgi:hypothetical protein